MKKWIALLVAVVMLFSLALAEEVSSKSVEKIAQVVELSAVNGAELDDDFVLEIIEEPEEGQERPDTLVKIDDEIAKMAKAVLEDNVKPVDYFGEENRTAIEAMLPEGVNAEEMGVQEFNAIRACNYKEEYGDVEATFQFITEYDPEQIVTAVVGIYADTEPETEAVWSVLEAVVTEDGMVKVLFPAELIPQIEEGFVSSLIILDAAK